MTPVKATGKAEVLRRNTRRRKNALSYRCRQQERVMYSSGLFDLAGPSSSQEDNIVN